MQERIGRLADGVAVIKVGGTSEVEVSELKDRITDALCSTRAAIEEGIVPGGGVALLYASKSLENIDYDNFDQNIGAQIVKEACRIPCQTICNNAGEEGSVIVDKLLEKNDKTTGYDANKGKFTNMIKDGIIDPVKVVRCALIDATGIASIMLTTEASIYDEKVTTDSPYAQGAAMSNPTMGGGMPGMGNGMF